MRKGRIVLAFLSLHVLFVLNSCKLYDNYQKVDVQSVVSSYDKLVQGGEELQPKDLLQSLSLPDDASLQDIALVSTEVPNWDDYDVVLFGYPIWWREASWVVNNFIKNNDFTGKTVIPFCTSTSSGLGDSGTNLEKMAGTGAWLEGRRFSENPSEDSVREWVRGLDLE